MLVQYHDFPPTWTRKHIDFDAAKILYMARKRDQDPWYYLQGLDYYM